uniref:Uncharacterized protein n=1 Tax=Pararge aegeria TaxID=116150 RepID=S4P386_9NEOP
MLLVLHTTWLITIQYTNCTPTLKLFQLKKNRLLTLKIGTDLRLQKTGNNLLVSDEYDKNIYNVLKLVFEKQYV